MSETSRDTAPLRSFVSDVLGDEVLRVEEDFGQGFVRLKSSEADRRQAAQDIQCCEDVVCEMLRNARDAGASQVFVATQRQGDARSIVVIDDGCGIPHQMHKIIFQPRVTSKLDSAKVDRWGFHGRGMALYSIKENAESVWVCDSSLERGTAIKANLDVRRLPEKADQSTFPRFEVVNGVHAMRGPKNILRTVAEFALESRDEIDVYCGSPTEVAATLYTLGKQALTPSKRVFGHVDEDATLVLQVSMASDAKELSELASRLGLEISERSARRIMDQAIECLPSMLARIECESFGKSEKVRRQTDFLSRTHIADVDLNAFAQDVTHSFASLAQKYYLKPVSPTLSQKGGKLTLHFDLIDED